MASTARPVIPERPLISRLREQLRAAEAATGLGDGASPLALGIPAIDGALGGGLASGALHEIAAAREAEIASATGFALALAAYSNRATRSLSAVVWIAENLALAENGAPYGPGLDQAGLVPERLITVAAARGRDVLWAMEEALRCRAVGLVIGEMRARGIDQVAMRRLSLAAAAGNTLGLFLRPAPDDAPSAAATRWIIGAAPSSSFLPSPERGGSDCRRQSGEGSTFSSTPTRRASRVDPRSSRGQALPLSGGGERGGVGPPRLAARLMRNRRGHLGTWIVEWDSVEQRFVLATHSELVVRSPVDRPHPAAVA